MSRRGLSLVEVLIASLIFVLAIIPTIGLFTSSQTEAAKARNRLIAVSLASAVCDDFRSRAAAERVAFGPQPANTLPVVTQLVSAHGVVNAAGAAAADTDLGGFSVTAALGVIPTAPTLTVTIAWKESGIDRSMVRTVRLEVDP